jgi:hypothetical protein
MTQYRRGAGMPSGSPPIPPEDALTVAASLIVLASQVAHIKTAGPPKGRPSWLRLGLLQ